MMPRSLPLITGLLLATTPLFSQEYQPRHSNIDGEEIIAVFITMSTCIGSRQPHMPASVEAIKIGLAEQGREQGFRFSVVGASMDWEPTVGVEHLRTFGRFDELIAGRNWWNSAATSYIWRDIPGRPATPQVVVLRRTSEMGPDGIRISREEEVHRVIGADEIEVWASAGAPLP
jgi:hypothetical protein